MNARLRDDDGDKDELIAGGQQQQAAMLGWRGRLKKMMMMTGRPGVRCNADDDESSEKRNPKPCFADANYPASHVIKRARARQAVAST